MIKAGRAWVRGHGRLLTALAALLILYALAPEQSQRESLERSRAEAVRAAIIANTAVTPERIFLSERGSGSGPPRAVRMELKLQ